MNKAAKWFLVAAIAGSASVAGVFAQNGGKSTSGIEDLLGDPVIAKGKGFEVKRSRLDEALASYRAMIVDRGGDPTRLFTPELEVSLLEDMIQIAILNQVATEEQKTRGRTEGDEAFAHDKKLFGSEDAFLRRMHAIRVSPEVYHQRTVEMKICSVVLHDKYRVSEEQMKKYYDEHPDLFMTYEKARILYVNLPTVDLNLKRTMSEQMVAEKRRKIDAVLTRAKAGEDFSKLVLECSESPTLKDDGGEAEFAHGDHSVSPEVEGAVFSMQTNQISDVIVTSLGFNVVKVLERKPARKLELTEISKNLRNDLEAMEIAKNRPKLLAELKKDYSVEVVDPELKKYIELLVNSRGTELGRGTNPPVGIIK